MPTFAAAIVPRFVRERRSSAVPSVVEACVIAILKQFEKLYTHMPLFTPYFSLDSSAYRVGNGGRLRCHMGAAGIGIYVMLLSHLRDCRDYRAPLDYDLLAFDLHEDADAVRRVVEEFDLFDIDRASGTFTSPALDAVRALGTSDSPSSGRTSTRTGRVRRVRTAAQAYRRSVRRLAADNALPPDADDDLAAETDAAPAEEEETPTADCATAEPADPTAEEGNDHSAETDFTPAEGEKTTPADAPRSAAEPAPAANENAPSPRTEEKRGEQNKIPHTPIVPFPPSGKGTRASHSSTPVVGEEEGTSVAEVEGTVPTVADPPFTPAEEEPKTPPADSPTAEIESAPADPRRPHGEGDTKPTTTAAAHPDTRTSRGEGDTTQTTTSAAHPDTRTSRGETDTTPTTTSDAPADPRTPHGETNTTQATTAATAPEADTPQATTAPLDTEAAADAHGADAEDGETFVPPTANEVRRFAQALHHPEFDAEWFVHYYTARHWQRHNGHPVRSWQTTARYWLTHPLQVAQHLLRHRPDPGAAPAGTSPSPAGTSVQLPGVSPSSAGTNASPAGIISTTGSANPSSPGLGAAPAGTRPSSPASGVPLGGSLSLPAPTPLQQSRLCDLRHMVHHLFADAPGAAPAAVSTVPDAPAATSTPTSSVPTSVPTPRVLSPAEAAHFIEAQTLAADPAEEDAPACEISAADGEEGDCNSDELDPDAKESIETQALSTARSEEEVRAHELSTGDNGKGDGNCDERPTNGEENTNAQAISTDPVEEENRACEISTADIGKGIDTQAFSTTNIEEDARAHELSTTDIEEGDGNCDELASNAKESIDAQAFFTDPAEEENRADEISTADNEESELNGDELASDAEGSIEAQAFSTNRTEEDARTCESDATDTEEGDCNCDELATDAKERIDTQAISTTKERFGVHSPHGPAPPTDDAHSPSAALHRPHSHTTEKHPFTLNLNHDAHPLLPLYPPAPVGLGNTLRVQSAQPPFGRALLGRIDIGNAPRPAGSRPLRPQPAEDRRATPDHIPLGGAHEPKHPADGHPNRDFATKRHPDVPFDGVHEPKTADSIDKSVAHEPQRRSADGKHPAEEPEHRDFAQKRHPDAPVGSTHEPKTADFIDNSTADEPQRRSDAGKHHADQHNSPADEHPSRSTDGKHHSDEHPHRPADQHNAPADEFDAGQRLLDTAAHRRAVRAELAACCGALRHLAHCCVAF